MYYKNRMPFLQIENYELNEDIVKSIPEKVCRDLQIIGIDRFEGQNNKILTIGIVDSKNIHAQSIVKQITGYDVISFKIDMQSWAKKLNEVLYNNQSKEKKR